MSLFDYKVKTSAQDIDKVLITGSSLADWEP